MRNRHQFSCQIVAIRENHLFGMPVLLNKGGLRVEAVEYCDERGSVCNGP